MIIRFGLLRRHEGMTDSEFASYWRGPHADTVKQYVTGIKAYLQNLVVDRSQKGIDYARGSIEVDGLAQLELASLAEARGMSEPAVLKALQDDEDAFLDSLSVLTALQNTVITPPRTGKYVKRMSFLRKRDDVSDEEFQKQWFDLHAVLVRRLPGIMGYRQNLVIDRFGDRFVDGSMDEANAVHGVVELWFESESAIDQAFRSPIGVTTMTHAREFISEISTFMVDVTEIIPEPVA